MEVAVSKSNSPASMFAMTASLYVCPRTSKSLGIYSRHQPWPGFMGIDCVQEAKLGS